MTDVKLVATELLPLGGASNDGTKVGFVRSGAKAAQNDTWTITNASEVLLCLAFTDADGVADPCTISGNTVTLTSATATPATAMVVYKA